MNIKQLLSNLMFCLMISATGVGCLAQTTETINVTDPRPLAQAALQLEKRVGVPINYEDAPYFFGGDIVDVADAVLTPAKRAVNPTAHIWIPKGGSLSVSLPITGGVPAAPSSVKSLLGLLVNAHQAEGFPGQYAVSSSSGVLFLTPASARDQAGAMMPVTPVFDTAIDLPYQRRSAEDTLSEILNQVSVKTGILTRLGTVPINGLKLTKVEMGASGQTARALIVQILMTMGSFKINGSPVPAFSYQLFFGPLRNEYALNIHLVQNIQQAPTVSTAPSTPPKPAINHLEKRASPQQ